MIIILIEINWITIQIIKKHFKTILTSKINSMIIYQKIIVILIKKPIKHKV
jgi:hypothetical protein